MDRVPTWVGKVVDTSELSTLDIAVDGEAAHEPKPDSAGGIVRSETPRSDGLRSDSKSVPESGALAPYEPNRGASGRRAAALFGAGAVVVLALAIVALNNRPDDASSTSEVDAALVGSDSETETLGEGDSLDVSGQLDADTTDNDLGVETEAGSNDSDSTASIDDAAQLSRADSMELFASEASARSRDAYGVFASGRLHILGTWADQESAEALGDRASILVGRQNIVYDVDFVAGTGESSDGASPVLFIDQPLLFADTADALDSSSAFLLETAGALMAIYPDARLTVIVPGLESGESQSEAEPGDERIDTLLATLESLGVPRDRISVEASASTQDETVPPFAMLSGGLFVP